MKRLALMVGTLIGITSVGLALLYGYSFYRQSKPAPWVLIVSEPLQGGSGFSTGYDSEANCKHDLQHWLDEAAYFKSVGREKDAPIAKCITSN